MEKLHRMVSIDLNTPTTSLSPGLYHSKSAAANHLTDNKRFHWKSLTSSTNNYNNDGNLYEKYFQKRIAKIVSFTQLGFAVAVLVCQLATTGLLIEPVTPSTASALSTSDRIGLGIWASIVTILAVGATFWALNKTNFCRLHIAMLLHLLSLIMYSALEYLVLVNTVPRIQERISFLEETTLDVDARRQLLNLNPRNAAAANNIGLGDVNLKNKEQMQAELSRLYAALILSILMALSGIFQLLSHFLMNLKTGRAIFLQINYFEGKLQTLQTIGSNWRNRSLRLESKNSTLELPKLERSDTLPPPPYESGYFHPSLGVK